MKTSRRRFYLILCLAIGITTSLLVNAFLPLKPGWIFALDIPDLPDVTTSPLLLPESQAMQSPIDPPGPGGGGPGTSTPTPTPEPDEEVNMSLFYAEVANYTAASFCPSYAPPGSGSTGAYVQYLPVVHDIYPFLDPSVYPSRYGVAGADFGGDVRGECPGTNDMWDLELPNSLSYHWNYVYDPNNPDRETNSNPVQMVYSPNPDVNHEQREVSLRNFLADNKGKLWIIGNEPDRKDQTNMCPSAFAYGYHEYRDIILEADPTAKIAIGAISQNPDISCPEYTYGSRESYIEAMLQRYYTIANNTVMPIDIWTIHQYPGQAAHESQVNDVVSSWLSEIKGITSYIHTFGGVPGYSSSDPVYADTPIWLTEFGHHHDEPYNRDHDYETTLFVAQATDGLEQLIGNERVDYWFWFMAHSGHTTYRCAPPARYSGFLFEQVTSKYGNEGDFRVPATATLNTITCSDAGCIDTSTQYPLPSNETWDRYTYIYFDELAYDDAVIDDVVYRISSSTTDTNGTTTLTLCPKQDANGNSYVFTDTVKTADTKFYLVRQRPEFDGNTTQLVLSSVGESYVEASIP